jgi:hypothetical protein
MSPTNFSQANCLFGPPKDLEESQCKKIPAFVHQIKKGSIDGATQCVVAWIPDRQDIERILQGQPIFLSVMGGLPPHYLSTSFEEATNPA